ncbi:hypothetical protein CRM22_005616 [Opisthorchis felineus]|uniref:Uncharacterized protein n=1 Tax=Opisthorchis felineus TaxID=147828 RepID=A0A4S2LQ87_OPIFE|nr:hypothetical protein CRM22_005616 [Opisthorchis felineus]
MNPMSRNKSRMRCRAVDCKLTGKSGQSMYKTRGQRVDNIEEGDIQKVALSVCFPRSPMNYNNNCSGSNQRDDSRAEKSARVDKIKQKHTKRFFSESGKLSSAF